MVLQINFLFIGWLSAANNSLSVVVYNVYFTNSVTPAIRVAMRNISTSTISVTVLASALCKFKES